MGVEFPLTAATVLAGRTRAKLHVSEPPDIKDLEGTLERSMAELTLKQEANREVWGLGSIGRWDTDLDLGIIQFSNPDGFKVTGQVQVVGTYDGEEGSWLWGWDHPTVPEPLSRAAELTRQFGEMHGLGRYTIPMIRCTHDHATEFMAVALHLSGGTGAYRGPFWRCEFRVHDIQRRGHHAAE